MSFTNVIAVDGNLVRDADVKYTDGGTCILSFSIAHNTKRGDKEEVYYFDCSAVGKYAEMLAGSMPKGASVLVIGRLQQRRWEKDGVKKSAISIFATQVMFNPPKKETAASSAPADGDIPF